jgi:hypothetical protein
MLITDFIEKHYSPASLEQYKECLNQFDWFHYMSDSYYPSLDAVSKVLYTLAVRNGVEWQKAYNEIHELNFNTESFHSNGGYKKPFDV